MSKQFDTNEEYYKWFEKKVEEKILKDFWDEDGVA